MFPIFVVSAVVRSRKRESPDFTEETLGGEDNKSDEDEVTYRVRRSAVVFVKNIFFQFLNQGVFCNADNVTWFVSLRETNYVRVNRKHVLFSWRKKEENR